MAAFALVLLSPALGRCAEPATVRPEVQSRVSELDRQCAHRSTAACTELFFLFWEGAATGRRPAEAARSYLDKIAEADRAPFFEGAEAACEQGQGRSCTAAGLARAAGGGRHVEERAVQLLAEGCNLGDPVGCFLAAMTETDDGPGAAPSALGLGWLRRACDGGEPEGCIRLGRLSEEGMTDDGRSSAAVRYFERACRMSDPEGCAMLAERLLLGDGVQKDTARATRLLLYACQGEDARFCHDVFGMCMSDNAPACLVLGKTTVANDLGLHLAAGALERACSLGSSEGCVALARVLLVGGERVARDETRAYELLDDACGDGSDEACDLLKGF